MVTSEFHMKNVIRSFLVMAGVLLWAVATQAKTASEVFEVVSPSIVVVKTYDVKGKAVGLGSGVVLADGMIVTNCHVIKGAASMKVEYKKNEYPASPHQTDWDRDVCTLTVTGLHAPYVVLGNTNRLKVGQQVYAVGAPKGLELTLSDGIVSSLRPVQGGQYLQITAPISPGSSGGGLFDDEGRLIGLPTFYLTEGQQLNFAVPVEWINELPKRQIATNPKKTVPQASQLTITDWFNKAFALLEGNDWPGLKTHTLHWTKAHPQDADAWNFLGSAYRNSKQITKAIEAYQQALRIDPEYANAWYNLGNAYGQSDQPAKAIEAYQQTIRIDPGHTYAWMNLGISYGESGQLAKAIEAYQQVLRINPEDADAWVKLGFSYGQSGQTAKAIESYQQGLRINPEHAHAWLLLGVTYGQSKQTAKAIEAYQQAIRVNPGNVGAWHNLGVAFKISGQTGKMMEVYKRLKTIDSDKADQFFNKVVMP